MRMKRKKNLDERIAASSDYLITMKNDSLDFQDAIKENHLLDFNKVFKTPCPDTSDLESEPFLSISSK